VKLSAAPSFIFKNSFVGQCFDAQLPRMSN